MIKYPIYVTLDTNILDSANYDFDEKSTLQLLANYVKKGKVKVVLSNIVVKEAEKHISEKEIFEIEKWISSKCEDASRKMEITNLPFDISLSNKKQIIANGTVELTVGYIEYDEDGGVADALDDKIYYSYYSIIEQLDNFILEQNEYMKTEKAIIEIIEEAIK